MLWSGHKIIVMVSGNHFLFLTENNNAIIKCTNLLVDSPKKSLPAKSKL